MLPDDEAMRRRADLIRLLPPGTIVTPLKVECPKHPGQEDRYHIRTTVHPLLVRAHGRWAVTLGCGCVGKGRMETLKDCDACYRGGIRFDAWMKCPLCDSPSQDTFAVLHDTGGWATCWSCFI